MFPSHSTTSNWKFTSIFDKELQFGDEEMYLQKYLLFCFGFQHEHNVTANFSLTEYHLLTIISINYMYI